MELVGEVPFRTFDPCSQGLNCINSYINPLRFILAMLPSKKEANQSIYEDANHTAHKATCDLQQKDCHSLF